MCEGCSQEQCYIAGQHCLLHFSNHRKPLLPFLLLWGPCCKPFRTVLWPLTNCSCFESLATFLPSPPLQLTNCPCIILCANLSVERAFHMLQIATFEMHTSFILFWTWNIALIALHFSHFFPHLSLFQYREVALAMSQVVWLANHNWGPYHLFLNLDVVCFTWWLVAV